MVDEGLCTEICEIISPSPLLASTGLSFILNTKQPSERTKVTKAEYECNRRSIPHYII